MFIIKLENSFYPKNFSKGGIHQGLPNQRNFGWRNNFELMILDQGSTNNSGQARLVCK